MKDLFVLTADSDAEALLRSVLERHESLEIITIAFDVRRFPGRDSGMVNQGPEVARVLVNKVEYSRVLLTWDHHGSGWESRSPEDALSRIQARLDGVTWAQRSTAIVFVPELEEWLWQSPRSIARHLGVTDHELTVMIAEAALKLGKAPDRCRRELPKELFETVLHSKERRRPLPEDFKKLGSLADLMQLRGSTAFVRLTQVLQAWFPPDSA
jgi:hypothetical protein